jgi:ligand-binding sensor domain-containing protein/signal transduction histidine kinase
MRLFAVASGIAIHLAAPHGAYALDSHRGITQYAQSRFEAHDGLAHNLVNSLAQTPDGYLWAGSEEGLTRYDGATFTSYDRRKTEGIPTNTFTALAVSPSGVLWAGTRDHGVLRLVDGEFHSVIWEPGADSAQIRSLTFDRGGDLWIGLHDRGVVRLRGTAPVLALATKDGLPSDDIRAVLAARDGTMWISTFRGVVGWGNGRLIAAPAELDGVAIDEIAQDAQGELWCATANGLAHIRGDRVEWIGGDRLPTARIRKLVFDRDGNLWLGTGKGVVRRTPDGRLDVLARPVAQVLALLEDSEGDLWIGAEGGLDRLRDGDVVPFGAAQGASDDAAFTVREDPSGAIWLGSHTGLHRVAPGQTMATKVSDEHGTVMGVFPDSRGDIWFGARDGSIGIWRDNQLRWLGRREWERVRGFSESGDAMWLATDNGAFRMRGEHLEDAEVVLSGIAVSAIAPGGDGAMWMATESGVMMWRNGRFVTVPRGGPPTNVSATTIQFDADGTMWVTTEGAGLWRLRGGTWHGFTSKDGLFDDLVWRLLDDGRGTFWMTSNRGITSVPRQQLEDRAAGLRGPIEYTLYGEADGMPNRECDGSMDPAGWRMRDGRLWFPTVNGFAIIDPAHLRRSPPPDAALDTVRVDGHPERLAAALDLAPGKSRLEIAYTAPALRNPERLKFRYRLDGFDRGWIDAGGQRVAQYTNLAPGDYRFVVEAGRDGAWGRAAAIAVTLRPSFYQTRKFVALAIVVIIAAIVAVPLLRIRQLRARERELAARIREAVRELAEREQRLRDTQAQLVEASRQAGRSDVATAVLHNVGNVLNSVNVSASLINDIVTRLKTGNLSRIAGLITQHKGDLGGFFRDDARGQKLPEYFSQLQELLERDKAAALAELKSLMGNLDHIKIIVSSQQSHVVPGGARETFDVHQLLEDAIKLSPIAERDGIALARQFDPLPPATLDRHKVLQILVNLLANARDAVMAVPAGERRIGVRVRAGAPGTLEVVVEDNGCGIAPENLDKVFQLGFTTKSHGHGLGLHYSACAALEMRGKLTTTSAGASRGAAFVLALPCEPAGPAAASGAVGTVESVARA